MSLPPPFPQLLAGRHRFMLGQPGKAAEKRLQAGIAALQVLLDAGQRPLLGAAQAHDRALPSSAPTTTVIFLLLGRLIWLAG
jgi:hypothetical protein